MAYTDICFYSCSGILSSVLCRGKNSPAKISFLWKEIGGSKEIFSKLANSSQTHPGSWTLLRSFQKKNLKHGEPFL